ncbi:TetR/AcrR family transcriptional regulator [Staphylococcus hominis]|uniref:TetR/AcrR family transcriptional regulator n=1 Tax=Staphylococcus TaxID=1279 RepID=UPI0008A47260|nr:MULTISPECIES: TetR/AcrR family transcriptional regulator [Staphylococcus]MBC2955091.1 TetR/AcrR family transcriptional regulator [Staphylococcus hominis]MBU5605760.1 TetR/AcrR family transcriptional regulator [Staphylococcus hominis]MDK7201859.1 TetR/AcrR family transcriptional regulator [Staphylococcus hominis]MDS3910272.1 TetR/AcrR family transcriptional regulator [Staphylococcus hominis]OFV20703.1 transcriptional regulator [Staphylococcus sp. HMSC14C01]
MPTANQKRMIKHINATVFKLLNDYHFDEITIQKICDNAEINRSTFYRYFQDKYDLLFSLPDYIATQFHHEDTRPFLSTEESFQQFIYFIGEHKKVFKHLLTSSRQADVFRNLTHVSRELMLDSVKSQNDPLALKIKHSHHPEIIADFYSSGMIEVLRRWVENDYNYSVDEIFATLHDILEISLNCK